MSDLDSTRDNPVFQSKPRIPRDALANARLARSRETREPGHAPDTQAADRETHLNPPA
jgi:hypothetical protein